MSLLFDSSVPNAGCARSGKNGVSVPREGHLFRQSIFVYRSLPYLNSFQGSFWVVNRATGLAGFIEFVEFVAFVEFVEFVAFMAFIGFVELIAFIELRAFESALCANAVAAIM